MDKQRMIREIDQEINRLNQIKRLLQSDQHAPTPPSTPTPTPVQSAVSVSPKKPLSDRSAAMKKAWARRKAAQAGK